jgi:putative spermidine/putrescine transport system ATP-binding protein
MSLEFERVTYRYPGTQAGVFDVTLRVESSELVAVIGGSGSGKTTLLRLVSGFLRAQQGRVTLDGKPIDDIPPRERDVGLVFQNYALFPLMSVAENVAYALKVRSVARAEREAAARKMLGKLGLAEFANRRPDTLSGGQQQRVALARALIYRPKVLLLDEPLSALDPALRGEMRDEILRIQREYKVPTLLVTHNQEEALSMADRVAVIEGGWLAQVATPQQLYDAPATAFVAKFVGHSNLFAGEVVDATHVSTEFGMLEVRPHGLPARARPRLLIRPERIQSRAIRDGRNAFPGRVTRDRFMGAFRHVDVAVGNSTLLVEVGHREPIERIAIPPEAVQLLPEERVV